MFAFGWAPREPSGQWTQVSFPSKRGSPNVRSSLEVLFRARRLVCRDRALLEVVTLSTSIWIASPPRLPPSPGLAETVATEQNPKAAKRLGMLLGGIAIVDVGLAATNGRAALVVALPVTIIWVYMFFGARRSFAAVGDGWLFVRIEAFGQGLWAPFSEMRTVRVRTGNGGVRLLYLTTSKRRHFRFGLANPSDATPMRRELARQALASSATITPEARTYLQGWTLDPGTRDQD